MLKIFRRTNIELRRVRWSSPKQTWKVFFIALSTLIFFALLVGLFTWGITALIDVLQGEPTDDSSTEDGSTDGSTDGTTPA